MRLLLVLTDQPLPDELGALLAESHWTPLAAQSGERAVAAAAGHDVYVGLALLSTADPTRLQTWSRVIRALPALHWVATMTRPQAETPALRQLIVERLYDYQVEPVEPMRLCHALGHAHGIAEIEQDLLRQGSDEGAGRYGMIGSSEVMRSLYDAIDRVAATDASLLISGPTGTGKELVASAIHARSERAAGRLVSLNCAAIPTALIQSELFGHTRGSFTGASAAKAGLIETAAGGTLFLDEIGEMPLESQASLLRFLDDRRIRPVGAEATRAVDVRVIAATNRDLEQEADSGRFRADLYYRLSVLTLRTPALKDRGGDIGQLADHFLQEARRQFDAAPIAFSKAALDAMRRQSWPGNVRELRSRIYQAAINCNRRYIEPADLGLGGRPTAAPVRSLGEIRNQAERDAVVAALRRNDDNVTQASKELAISRMTLYRLIEKHGLNVGSDGGR